MSRDSLLNLFRNDDADDSAHSGDELPPPGKTPPAHPPGGQGPYQSSRQHLFEHLARIHTLVKAQTERWHRAIAQHKPQEEWGMWKMTQAEVDAVLDSSFPGTGALSHAAGGESDYLAQAQSQLEQIERRCASQEARPTLRLERLQALFHFPPEQRANLRDILLVCLLPEVNSRYRRVYGYLQDNLTHVQPSVDLIQKILQPQLADPAQVLSLLSAQSPLLLHDLLHWQDDGVDLPLPLRSLHVDERIVAYLLEQDVVDRQLSGVRLAASGSASLDDLLLPTPEINETLAALARELPDDLPLTMLWPGAYGSGRRAAAAAFCRRVQLPLLTVDVQTALARDLPWRKFVSLTIREALLRDAALYWHGCEQLAAADDETRWQDLLAAVSAFPGLTILASESSWSPSRYVRSHTFLTIDFPMPNFETRRRLWQEELPGPEQFAQYHALLPEMLASSFQLTGGQIRDTLAVAKGFARRRNPSRPLLRTDDLFEAARRQSSGQLIALARHVKPRQTLIADDPFAPLVLPAPAKLQLYELLNRINNQHRLYEHFGYAEQVNLGRGTYALFSGSSGTGKTMAAELLASARRTDLYKIDMAAVVSKYVGETEKNLNKLFEQAEDSNAILFFDEADALFGKRGEVKDARDRWANLEVNFLLQRIEEYEGIVIMATNLRQNIDAAFLRRIPVIIEFPFPDAAARLDILRGLFPQDMVPPDDDTLAHVAAQFELAGGSWKNIVVDSAFRALAQAQPGETPVITLPFLILAVAREYQKVGRPITRGEFSERFYPLIEELIF